MSADNENDKSPHILNASSNLLGLCFVVLTSLKLFKLSQKTIIDELTTLATVLFMGSCLLSFLAIRTSRSGRRYERIADYFFLAGLILMFLTVILFSFDVIS